MPPTTSRRPAAVRRSPPATMPSRQVMALTSNAATNAEDTSMSGASSGRSNPGAPISVSATAACRTTPGRPGSMGVVTASRSPKAVAPTKTMRPLDEGWVHASVQDVGGADQRRASAPPGDGAPAFDPRRRARRYWLPTVSAIEPSARASSTSGPPPVTRRTAARARARVHVVALPDQQWHATEPAIDIGRRVDEPGGASRAGQLWQRADGTTDLEEPGVRRLLAALALDELHRAQVTAGRRGHGIEQQPVAEHAGRIAPRRRRDGRPPPAPAGRARRTARRRRWSSRPARGAARPARRRDSRDHGHWP